MSITPDKKDIYITINVTEGDKYTVSDVKIAGEALVTEEELRKLLFIKAGDTYSGERLTASTKAIQDRLGALGYAFANANRAARTQPGRAQGRVHDLRRPGPSRVRAPHQRDRQYQDA